MEFALAQQKKRKKQKKNLIIFWICTAFSTPFITQHVLDTPCNRYKKAIWCHFQPHHAKLTDFQLWKNNILFERVKGCASEKSGWYSPQRCWWQSVRAGRGNENGLKCLAPFHAALTSMTTLAASSLPPSFAFFRLKFALSVPRLLTLWVRGWESRGTDERRADFWESVTSHDAPLFFPTPRTHVRFTARFQHRYETTLGGLVAYL